MGTFGEEMKALRKAKRITQRDLADMVGVDFSYISKMENGKLANPPAEETLRKIAAILQTNADDFVVLARKVPKDLQETIVNDDFVVNFLRVAPRLDLKQRQAIQSVMDEAEKNDK